MPLHDGTIKGDLAHIPAGEDLTAKEAHLLSLTHDSGEPEFVLPALVNDDADYLLIHGAADGEPVTVRPLEPGIQHRVRLKGACNPGDRLMLADPATPADKGKVRAVPTANGTYRSFLRAEQAGTDGQVILCRKVDALTEIINN